MEIHRVRVARPTDRLEQAVAFYRDVVGLAVIGGFDDHAGYSGVMLGLPGNAVHLELTARAGSATQEAPDADDLLVLYCTEETLTEVAARAAAMGVECVPSLNPYWDDEGALTLVDPDGRRVVIARTEPLPIVGAIA